MARSSLVQTMRQKFSLRQRILLLLLSLALIVLIVLGFTAKDRMGLSFFGRHLGYNNDDISLTFSHGARSESLFASVDYQLLACSDSYLQLFSPLGELRLREPTGFTSPAISSNGKQAVVYDVGGSTLFLVEKDRIKQKLSLNAGEYLLSANINQSGWVAVCSKEKGYKGVVTIYKPGLEKVLSIYRSSSYLQSAIVTPDNRGVYILSPGQNAGVFESRLLYYSLADAEAEPTQISLGNNALLSLYASGNQVWALGENQLFLLSSDGELRQQFPYIGKYLKRASLEGNDFAALLLADSPSGNSGTLVTVDNNGQAIASVDIGEQVLSLSASGRYVAVLTPGRLRIFTKDLVETHQSEAEDVQGITKLLLYPDGSVALIGNENARLYLP